ncbi:AI-2E family transporter [Flavobacterium branchiophilum]|uniref:AI-2E family transporter n=2 Tax=Flavobacterium branchiophilum TaxID=55197 RepID=A0A2H3KDW6_9FLAO|nr:AI-2E family transporter [Flavobacterium branchiophilum]PDS26264.1 AI-2E family transporter [Flavobacterium branchiophilum]CCB69460.1 Putative transporting permease [Flavobacterium branchiophilum FL-15]
MITSKIIAQGILKSVLYLILITVFLYFLYELQTILLYIILSVILALILNPFIEFLRKKLNFSNNLAVITSIIVIFLIFIGFIMMFIPLITTQSKNLSLLNINQIEHNIVNLIEKIKIYLLNHNVDLNKIVKKNDITSKINLDFIPNFLNSTLSLLGNFGMGFASILFITFFILKDKVLFIIGIKKLIPDSHEEKILNSLHKTNEVLSNYLIGLIIQLTIVFVLYLIVLLIFDIENAFIIAFLCALLNIIPYIGPMIGSVIAALLTMLNCIGGDFQTQILPTTLYVMFGFILVQMIDNNVSQPMIFSKKLNSHPLEIFLITLIFGTLFGIAGMIIAIPLYTILKVILKEFMPNNKLVIAFTKNV